jgi:hypothetical protein
MELKGKVLEVNLLTPEQKEAMFKLLHANFENVTAALFEKDLLEKHWVILLEDVVTGNIKGFSTQMLLEAKVEDETVRAIFSGDTIIDKSYWGGNELVKCWFHLVFSLMDKYDKSKLYWFLISMGYKTYRFLPVYFKNFYPCFDKITPALEKKVMDTFAYLKYPKDYDNQSGLIRFSEKAVYLKKGIAEVETFRLKDPHIKFFVEKNPLYTNGDELPCLAELSYYNFKPVVYKMMPRRK